MNVKWGNWLYKLKLEYNLIKPTKNICCQKGKCAVDPYTVNGWFMEWFMEFRLGCKHLDNQAKSGRAKIADSVAVCQVTEANLASSDWRVSGELSIPPFIVQKVMVQLITVQ